MTQTLPRPLAGVKVLDLSRVLAGPYCASLLADLGAETVKIEIPERGDDARAFGPFQDGESCYFMQANRGKKSVTLDLKSEEGLDLLRRMAANSDILVENFRPGVTARLGIDYEALKHINPRLIYVSISGFGQSGPLAHRPAYDHIVQAMGGIMTVTGWPDGPPTRVGDSIGDVVAGLFGAFGALAAHIHRSATGEGQHVDVAMLDTMMAIQMVALSQIMGGIGVPARFGNAHSGSAPMDTFPASDGHVVIAVANNALFAKFADLLGVKELPTDTRFCSDIERVQNRADLNAIIAAWTQERCVASIVETLENAGIPVGPIWSLEEALSSEHSQHREILRETTRPDGKPFSVMPQPVRFSKAPADGDFTAPTLGADTFDVLKQELELSDVQLARLRERGII
ncbi:CaiB/BaiF CoA transferase family protein [Rhizobium rhizogenes]|uniref:CaiB/BaiF CoA transferase family protein n=1 Tax=Rhizobium rhizogenes TaxID=359 RepID=UPI001573492E|nr:CoA transferase [Rhizobium rhizogenes]NTH22875.1 CoA transferase [Rhizobium rhizogenes]NTH35904.1 CoA transferase [Rhizobium rhizogenes]